VGADLLAFLTGGLAFLIQEAVSDYPRFYKICISLLFAVNFFFASQLIGSDRKFHKVLGVFFFLAPVIAFFSAFLVLVPRSQMTQWASQLTLGETLLISFVVLSVVMTFAFAFLKNRQIRRVTYPLFVSRRTDSLHGQLTCPGTVKGWQSQARRPTGSMSRLFPMDWPRKYF